MSNPLRPAFPAPRSGIPNPTKPAEDLVLCDGIWMSRRAASKRAGEHLAETIILLVRTAALWMSKIEG